MYRRLNYLPVITLIAMFALFAAAPLRTHAETKPLADYVKVLWGKEEGLPQDSIKKVLQTRDGYVWVGTQEGLARFDGVHFTIFNTENSPGLESDNIHDLAEDGESNLWIFANSGLSRYRDGVIENFTPRSEKSGERVSKIWIGRDHKLYVASDDLYYRYENGQLVSLFSSKDYFRQDCWNCFDLTPDDIWGLTAGNRIFEFKSGKVIDRTFIHSKDAEIASLAVDGTGRLWAGGKGIYYFNGARFVPYAHRDVFGKHDVEWLTLDKSNVLWCIAGDTIYSLSGETWKPRKTVPGLRAHGYRLGDDASGNACAWIQGDQSDNLIVCAEGDIRSIDVPERLPVEWALPVMEDAQGSIWIGTKSGLVALKDPSCHTYGKADGVPDSPISVVTQDNAGTIWIGTDTAGLGSIVNGRYVPCTAPEFAKSPIISICPGDGHDIWVSTRDTLYRFDGKVAVAVVHVDNIRATDIARNALCRDSKGDIWFADMNDLYRFHDGVQTHYTKADGFDSDSVCLAITPDQSGGVWIGTLEGCTHFDGHTFVRYDAKDGLPTVPVIAIHEDANGEVWLGTWGGGLFRWKNGKIAAITSRDGLYANSIHQILEDQDGFLWIGSAKGIFRVSRQTLDSFANGVKVSIKCDAYGRDEGAGGGQCHGGTQPSACVASDRSLWFASLGGVVRVLPARKAAWNVPFLIEQATVDGKTVPVSSAVTASPGRGDIEIHYSALDYASPQKVHFEYKLSGFDKTWTDASTRRVAYYTNVPPGTYRFVVRAHNGDGLPSVTQPSLSITIQPHFYQTVWFKALCVLLVALVGIAAFRVRVSQLKAHNRYLEAKVSARTEELTDANEELRALHEELVAQNESLQTVQAAVEAQNEELTNVKAQLETRNEDLDVANKRLESLVTLDGLTGLKNHRAFQEHLEQQWANAQRHNTHLSLILMDVDRFKQYNDTYGHPAGDEVLKTVGRVLLECARTEDFVARYGGEEFVIVLPQTDSVSAVTVAERFRAGIENAGWPLRAVTASFGVASISVAVSDRAALIAEADRALYASKEAGRNRVTHISDISRMAA